MMTNKQIEVATLRQLNEQLAAVGYPSKETRLDNARNAVKNMIANLTRPAVEICSCTEWVRDNEVMLNQDGIADFDLNEAADYYASRVYFILRDKGWKVSWPQGNRSLYHGWNGADFKTKQGCVGSWTELTDEQIAVIDEARATASKDVTGLWATEVP